MLWFFAGCVSISILLLWGFYSLGWLKLDVENGDEWEELRESLRFGLSELTKGELLERQLELSKEFDRRGIVIFDEATTAEPTTAADEEIAFLNWIISDALLLLSHSTGFDGDGEETLPPIGPIIEEIERKARFAGVEVGPTLFDNAVRYGDVQIDEANQVHFETSVSKPSLPEFKGEGVES